MPNWCDNSVTIRHKDPVKLAALAEAINNGDFCKSVLPIPEALANTSAPNREPNAGDLVEQTGYADWYDFCVNEWGTKWDVNPYDKVHVDGDTLEFSFDSAWSPPTGIYQALYEQGYSVTGYYYEPGMCFVGKWEDGDDEYYEYSDYDTAADVREHIGEELDDMFCISEGLEQDEDENP